MTCPPVQRIEFQRARKKLRGLLNSPKFPQHNYFKVTSAQVVGVETKRVIEMTQRGNPLRACAINLCECMIPGSNPGLIPSRFVERGISLLVASLVTQTQAEIVIRFTVIG